MPLRHHEGQRLGQVGRQAHDDGALAQRLAHQAPTPLDQVTHAAVQQLGRARGRATRKIACVHHRHATALQRGLHGHAQTSRATAHHEHIQRVIVQGAGPVGQFRSDHLMTIKPLF